LTGLCRGCDDARRFLLKAKEACLDLKEIKTLIDLMKKNDLSVFKMEKEGFKITLKKGSDFQPIITTQVPGPIPSGAPASAAAALPGSSTTPTPPAETESLKEITSPMVGTFYEAPSPESAPYVQVGQEVTEDTVVCIIEAMKVMNEIKAEVRGVIAEIVAENGKPVQFGQPLFKVR
jgi:acetyl-CoA carboxylase biotin carboxyl carrier protein